MDGLLRRELTVETLTRNVAATTALTESVARLGPIRLWSSADAWDSSRSRFPPQRILHGPRRDTRGPSGPHDRAGATSRHCRRHQSATGLARRGADPRACTARVALPAQRDAGSGSVSEGSRWRADSDPESLRSRTSLATPRRPRLLSRARDRPTRRFRLVTSDRAREGAAR